MEITIKVSEMGDREPGACMRFILAKSEELVH
jgi:hypothetical protein